MTRTRSMILLVVVLATVMVLTGGLIASNMGFKFKRELLAGSDWRSNSGTQTLGLPFIRQVGIDTASDLFRDIPGVQNIQAYDTTNDSYMFYSFGSPDFALEPGMGLFIKVGQNSNYLIVGAHDPSVTIQFEAAGTGSNSGTILYAPPFHGTALTAMDLFLEFGGWKAQLIQGYDTEADTFVVYSWGSSNFQIKPGEAYFVKVATSFAHVPSHY